MIIRIIILFLIFKFHRNIYNFLLDNNLFQIQGIQEKISNTFDTAHKYLTTNRLEQKMLELKKMHRPTYQEVKKRIKNINNIYQSVQEEKDISLRNSYVSIKDEKKKIKNRISSMTVSIGFHEGSDEIIKEIEKYINDIIKNVLDIRDRRGINTDWFEGTWYEPVVAYDAKNNLNYDLFTQ